ncbi:MAG: hypothetical protein IJC31_03680 [Spirochaetaceae bacterium]|nr:hypothetical protein [Spirochaetaceae bacterium]
MRFEKLSYDKKKLKKFIQEMELVSFCGKLFFSSPLTKAGNSGKIAA